MGREGVAYIWFSGTGTLDIQGRNDPADNFISIGQYTTDTVVAIPLTKEIRVNISANSASIIVRVRG
jgi:hypothetical protein